MEVKLSHRPQLPSPAVLRKLVPSQSFNLESWVSCKKSIKNHFTAITEKWRVHILEMSKIRYCARYVLVHVIKEGESLTTIAEQYGISIHAIAAVNRSIVNVEVGQHLNIPCGQVDGLAFWTNRTELCSSDNPDTHQSADSLDRHLHEKVLTAISTHQLPLGNTTAALVVLVPFLVVCIKFVISALHAEVVKIFAKRVLDRSRYHSKTMRWRAILDDVDEPRDSDAQLRPNPATHAENHDETVVDELSHDYIKLQHDYQKFLVDFGISNYGYWRGGSSNET